MFGAALITRTVIGDGWVRAWGVVNLGDDKFPDLVHAGVLPSETGGTRQVFVKRGRGDGSFDELEVWAVPGSVASAGEGEEVIGLSVTSTAKEDVVFGSAVGVTVLRVP